MVKSSKQIEHCSGDGLSGPAFDFVAIVIVDRHQEAQSDLSCVSNQQRTLLNRCKEGS